jgi:hypothetical protein
MIQNLDDALHNYSTIARQLLLGGGKLVPNNDGIEPCDLPVSELNRRAVTDLPILLAMIGDGVRFDVLTGPYSLDILLVEAPSLHTQIMQHPMGSRVYLPYGLRGRAFFFKNRLRGMLDAYKHLCRKHGIDGVIDRLYEKDRPVEVKLPGLQLQLGTPATKLEVVTVEDFRLTVLHGDLYSIPLPEELEGIRAENLKFDRLPELWLDKLFPLAGGTITF